eukprot:7853533-Pyramimonas_sp.AAC.1
MGDLPITVKKKAAKTIKDDAITVVSGEMKHDDLQCAPCTEVPHGMVKIGQKLVWIWNPDGRTCFCCGVKDSDPDPVLKSVLPGRAWAYPPKVKGGKHESNFCWYCLKVFYGRYRVQYGLTMSQLPGWLTRDSERMATFKKELEALIKHMAEQGELHNVPR